jgi:hypothetical protein
MARLPTSPLRAARFTALTLLLASPACAPGEPARTELSTETAALTAEPWERGHAYSAGDLVSSGGKVYRCIQPHTSLEGWDPENVPALWGFEGLDEPDDPALPSQPPAEGLSFDYITLEADCDANPDSCCQVGSVVRRLTEGSDTLSSTAPDQCIVALGGRDTIYLQSPGASSLLLGGEDDVAMDGPGDDLIWGGTGRDTIHGHGGTNLFFAGWGDDTIMAANGDNTVVPGPGADTVACGTGNDSVHVFDVCEVSAGERIDGGSGFDTLYIPVPLAELSALGVTVTNFEKIVVRPEPCRSQCADPATCDLCPDDPTKMEPGACGCNMADFNLDKDSAIDCLEDCDLDPNKVEQGVCGCGVPDVDSNGNGLPDCIDEQEPGTCNDPAHPVPVGTTCSDGACAGTFECRADGQCGDPRACTPSDCRYVNNRGKGYWFCRGPRSFDDAQAFCRQEPGRHLVRIGGQVEAAFVHFNLDFPAWTGGHDRGADGTYRWSSHTSDDSHRFWDGGADGRPFMNRYARWAEGQPEGGAGDCVSIDAAGRWTTSACSRAMGFVCESSRRLNIGPWPWPRPRGPGAGDGVDDHDDEDCVEEATLFPQLSSDTPLADFIADGEACTARCSNASDADCAASCQGPLAPPTGTHCEEKFEHVRFYEGAGACDSDALCPVVALDDLRGDRISSTPVCATRPGTTQRVCAMRDAYPSSSVVIRELGEPALLCSTELGCPTVALEGGPELGVLSTRACLVVGDPPNLRRECRMIDVYPPGVGYNSVEGKPSAFPSSFCDEVSLCGDGLAPEETIHSLNDNGGDLTPEDLPESFLGEPEDKGEAPRFAGALTPPSCPGCTGQNHPWCRYDMQDTLQERAPAVPAKQGSSGDAIAFNFSPSFSMFFGGAEGQPNQPFGAFGVPNVSFATSTSVSASVDFDLPAVGRDSVSVIDAHAGLDAGLSAEQCGVNGDVGVQVFGVDFIPSVSGPRTWPSETAQAQCKDALALIKTSANRAEKAYHDALELVRQYREAAANDVEADSWDDDVTTLMDNFGPSLCGQIFDGQGAPVDFQADPSAPACPKSGETAETTINRFIDYYSRTLGVASDPAGISMRKPSLKSAVDQAAQLFGQSVWSSQFVLVEEPPVVEEHTLFQAQFFIGPVPCNLEVFLTTEYGLKVYADIRYNPAVAMQTILSPGCLPDDEECLRQEPDLIHASIHANPGAGVGLGMFAGVGFSVNGFTTKLGVQGDLSLGRIGTDGHVGAGFGLTSVIDDRPLPLDLEPLFPEQWARGDTQLPTRIITPQLRFDAGLGVGVRDILSGSFSAKLKIKIAFFSKSWSKRLLKFNGICAGDLATPLEGCDIALLGDSGNVFEGPLSDWGALRMPSPFALIPKLPPAKPIPTHPGAAGPLVPDAKLQTDRVEKFFYDSLCQCAPTQASPEADVEEAQGCYRDADCCGAAAEGAYCFKDPLGDVPWGVCITEQRGCLDTCGKDSDCAPRSEPMLCRTGTQATVTTTYCMREDADSGEPTTWCPSGPPR